LPTSLQINGNGERVYPPGGYPFPQHHIPKVILFVHSKDNDSHDVTDKLFHQMKPYSKLQDFDFWNQLRLGVLPAIEKAGYAPCNPTDKVFGYCQKNNSGKR